jgi:CyaY protein
MDEASFDKAARDELRHIEDSFADIDPDDVDVTTSDGVLRLDLRDGTKIVINSHRAARQIWMAAVASAWHFDPVGEAASTPSGTRWVAPKSGEELHATLTRLVRERIGVDLRL